VLDAPPYSFTFWDEDTPPIDPNDNMFSIPFGVTDTGTFNASSVSAIVNWTISKQIAETYSDTDTVYVYAPPVIGNVTNSVDSVCAGDSIMLAVAGGNAYQWYNDTNLVFGALDSVLWAHISGNYSVLATNSYNCTASSDTVTATIVDYPPVPSIANMGDHLRTFTIGYAIQWYMNGIIIPGATYDTLNFNQAGDYSLTLTNDFGCVTASNSIYVIPLNIESHDFIQNSVRLYPNPNDGVFILNLTVPERKDIVVTVTDIMGHIVYDTAMELMAGMHETVVDMDDPASGIYLLKMQIGDYEIFKKLIIR
jgi:hypothetical protein